MGLFDKLSKSSQGAMPEIRKDGKDFLFTDCAHVALRGDMLAIEFGLWLEGSANVGQPRPVHLVVMSLFTAKRLQAAFAITVGRHEEVFGPIRVASTTPQGKIGSEQLQAHYANFGRVSGTPEEVIIDFGVNLQPTGTPQEIVVSQTLVMSFPTIKQLNDSMQRAISEFETRFGVIEPNIEARAKGKGRQSF